MAIILLAISLLTVLVIDIIWTRRINEWVEVTDKRIKELRLKIAEQERKPEEPRCYTVGCLVPENTYIGMLGQELKAIKDYLKIDIKWHYEDDPDYPKPEPHQIKVWQAEKRK